MNLYIVPGCGKCEEVLMILSKRQITVNTVSVFDKMDRRSPIRLDHGLPLLELEGEWLDYNRIIKHYRLEAEK